MHCGSWVVKEPVGCGESPLPSDIQTPLSARSGPECQLEEHARHVQPGAPNHTEASGHLSRFPIPEPGEAWIELLWPNRGAGFGPQHIAFRSEPRASPGAYKREQRGANGRPSSR